MIRRGDFEDYLCRHCGCRRIRQRDLTLQHTVGGYTYHASFGDHSRQQVHRGEARRFLLDLHFNQAEIADIMNHF